MYRTALAALAFACVCSSAMAAEIATVGDTAVILPWGAWLVAIVEPLKEVLAAILLAAITVVVGRLGPLARMFITDELIERTVRKWLDYGFAQTAEAVKGRTLSVETSSTVIANSLNRAASRADVSAVSKWVLREAGGAQEVANKFVRMLPLEEGATGSVAVARGLSEAHAMSARHPVKAGA